MKKLLVLVLAFAMLLSFSQVFAASSYPISLKGTTVIMPGQTTKWSANQWVWWTSGNPGVATIDQNGNIKALKAGVSNITATAANGTKKNVLLHVKAPAATGINLAGITAVYVGNKVQWKATVLPADADQAVTWTSGYPAVASVDKDGNITAHRPGKAHITATTANGIKKTVTFSVYNYPKKVYLEKDWDKSSLQIDVDSNQSPTFLRCFYDKFIWENNRDILLVWRDPSDYLSETIDPQLVALSNEICKDIVNNDYEKVRRINKWVAENIYYDYDYFYNRSTNLVTFALGVYATKRSVCAGYANLMQALIQAQNIPCQIVSGYALGISTSGDWNESNIYEDSNHAWNRAYVNNRWINLDATWDSGNRYENGQYIKRTRRIRYFDMTDFNMAQTHKVICIY